MTIDREMYLALCALPDDLDASRSIGDIARDLGVSRPHANVLMASLILGDLACTHLQKTIDCCTVHYAATPRGLRRRAELAALMPGGAA